MADIGESAGNAIIAPAFVLLGNADDQRFQFRTDPGTSRIGTVFRAVELAGDQAAIPGEDGFGFGNKSHFRQPLPAEPLADFAERRPLGVGQPQSTGEVGAEDSILRRSGIRTGGAGVD